MLIDTLHILLLLAGTASVLLFILSWALLQKQKKIKEEIQILKRHRTDFIANLSHELKTPLTSIKGYTETLRDGALRDSEKAETFLQKIEDNVLRLDLLIHDILDLSRLEATDEHLQVESFELQKFLQSIKDLFSHRLEQKSQLLSIDCAVATMKADPHLLEQALLNLIANAHRYCPEGALIEVRVRNITQSSKSFHQIDVIDNGPGIPEGDLPRIFERFYRADKSRTRSAGGTGLGLAIVKHIVLSHGGQVKARNLPKGGMNFSLLFPTS